MATPSDLAETIGARLRGARQRQGRTLEHVATVAGLSVAFLSRLERGAANASIGNLISLARALGQPLAGLFEDIGGGTPRYVLRRADEAAASWLRSPAGYAWRRLGGDLRNARLDAFELVFPAGPRKAIELVSHEGEEFLEVTRGRLEFHLGQERLEMAPGDTLHFDAAIPHMGRALGNAPAHLLMVHTLSGAATQAPPAFRALRDVKPAANLSQRRRA
jgi:transcriptional regulator with XRE-family HTH domain